MIILDLLPPLGEGRGGVGWIWMTSTTLSLTPNVINPIDYQNAKPIV